MPGLAGFTTERMAADDALHALAQMRQRLTCRPDDAHHALHLDRHVAATACHPAHRQARPSPARCGAWDAWVDGELHGDGSEEPAAWLAQRAAADPDLGFLAGVDGHFSAVLHDRSTGAVHLVSDRCGLRHLYWAVAGGRLAWASEAKAFLDAPGFEPRFDAAGLEPFLKDEHLPGARTWFEGVSLLEPATVLTWTPGADRPSTRRYWGWDRVRRLGEHDEEWIVAELGRRFRSAVASRLGGRPRLGLTLSGGLDSRALLAAAGRPALPTLTFGQAGSGDVAIARRVARAAGSRHHVLDLAPGPDWLDERLRLAWMSDGHLSLRHAHLGPSQIQPIGDLFSTNLSGFLGDALLGGSYLGRPEGLEGRFLGRGRRFVYEGIRVVSPSFESRLPFFANPLLELTLALPDALRRDGRAYHAMLLREFPAFFRSIPWQKTGVPIGWGPRRLALDRLLRRGRPRRKSPSYADFSQWVRTDAAWGQVSGRLLAPDARTAAWIDADRVRGLLREHAAGVDQGKAIGALLTVEAWLRDVERAAPPRRAVVHAVAR